MDKIELTDAAMKVLKERYFYTSEDGSTETIEDLLMRVATNVAEAENLYSSNPAFFERWRHRFYEALASFDFLPNSPTLMNAGLPLQQLAACFVLPIDDTLSNGDTGILDIQKNAALIHKTGGGTGFSFTRLRPDGVIVEDTSGNASGPVSFMKMFDATTDAIKQGGKRRGANIGVLRVDHPEIMEFIKCKREEGILSNFNISVGIIDAFMDAVKNDLDWDLLWDGEVTDTVKAREIWDELVEGGWANGEPGILFLDTANNANCAPSLGEFEATNPCGELFLFPYESCNLGSINVSNHYCEKKNDVDVERLVRTIHTAVRFLDNVIDMNKLPLEKIKETTQDLRRIGLGVMGFADLLIKMKVRYGSEESLKIAKSLMEFIETTAYEASEALAVEKGPFPAMEREKALTGTTPRRNINLISIAPTGTISMIAGCSSGIEPVFEFRMNKHVLDAELDLDHHLYKEWEISAKSDAIVPDYFISAGNVCYEEHVLMQATFQKHVDSSISKTVNFPNSATREEIAGAYMMAWEKGCKGITVYRDGSRKIQVLVSKDGGVVESSAEGRPKKLRGFTEKVNTGEGTLYVTVNEDEEGDPFELFVRLGKSGADGSANSEALGRMASLCLRSGIHVEDIIKQLSGIAGSTPTWDDGKLTLSVPDAVASVLSVYVGGEVVGVEVSADKCPECKLITLVREEGCFTCRNCGYSKCG